MDEKSGPFNVARFIEDKQTLVAAALHLQYLDPERARAFLTLLVAQNHGLARREITVSLCLLVGCAGNIQSDFFWRGIFCGCI